MGLTDPVRQVFRGASVLVTGHTGFKGSWLSLWLSELGANVTGYGLATPTEPSLFHLAQVSQTLKGHHEADVRDFGRLLTVVREAKPDFIFHLAAQSLVRASYQFPRETFEVNVQGTVNLLDAVRTVGAPCVVIAVTSDKAYENLEVQRTYRETDPFGGHDPYSASKGAAELVVSSFRQSFFSRSKQGPVQIKLSSALAGNVVGGGDFAPDRIVVDLVRSFERNEPALIRNPRAVRPFQHVLDPLGGYLTLAACMKASDDPALQGPFNFGPAPGRPVEVRVLVERFIEEWGSGTWKDVSDPSAPHEAGHLQLSIDKACSRLPWRPVFGFEETVARTARWYLHHLRSGGNALAAREACLEDLAAYDQRGASVD